jgi:quercetin dioxygenase-like cupin family protein
MQVRHSDKVEQQTVLMKGARGCTVRWLINECDGATNFAMRQFELAAGGHTPHHSHPYEHEVFILEGEGIVMEGETEHPLAAGDVVIVCPNEVHQFRNPTAKPLKFLCLVPNSALHPQEPVTPECQAGPTCPAERR